MFALLNEVRVWDCDVGGNALMMLALKLSALLFHELEREFVCHVKRVYFVILIVRFRAAWTCALEVSSL